MSNPELGSKCLIEFGSLLHSSPKLLILVYQLAYLDSDPSFDVFPLRKVDERRGPVPW